MTTHASALAPVSALAFVASLAVAPPAVAQSTQQVSEATNLDPDTRGSPRQCHVRHRPYAAASAQSYGSGLAGTLVVPASGRSAPFAVPYQQAWVGSTAYARVFELDAGAAGGISMTQGLEPVGGY